MAALLATLAALNVVGAAASLYVAARARRIAAHAHQPAGTDTQAVHAFTARTVSRVQGAI
jgi:hypothetical protein